MWSLRVNALILPETITGAHAAHCRRPRRSRRWDCGALLALLTLLASFGVPLRENLFLLSCDLTAESGSTTNQYGAGKSPRTRALLTLQAPVWSQPPKHCCDGCSDLC